MRKRHVSPVAAVVGLGVVGALLLPGAPAFAANSAQLRVDQDGYLPSDTKIAYLMGTEALSGETYKVIDSSGATVAGGSVTTSSRGDWNSAYPDVYPIDFSSVSAAGTYHVAVSGTESATSDDFQIESPSSLYGPLVGDGVNFFENQRDGADMVGTSTIAREPSHLNDASATVYQDPDFIANSDGGTGDQISGELSKVSGASAVDVEGGWFDAGDYLKFTFTTAYADDLLYSSDLALGSAAPASLTAEAQYGTTYLNKMWNASTKTLYLQVGIGEGDESDYLGDHDLWRLPQVDDSDTNAEDYYAAAHRPVFEAAAPGAKISPDVVGRVAAAFAFAAQQEERSGNASGAQTELSDATSLYAMADTSAAENDKLTSTLPEAYYPEGIWHDAMELAATEIVRAEQDLGDAESTYSSYLTQAATWASDYIADDSGQDTLNLYDVSALAHADLVTAITDAGSPSGLAVTTAGLIADLKAQLSGAAGTANSDIFHEGGDYTNFDVDSHTFGFISTEALYQKLSGDTEYAAFAGEERDWLFGANAWGTSFVAGVGTTYPKCMGGQLENLDSAVDVGAVVNGPNGTSNFDGGLGSLEGGMVKCENDSFTTFTGHGGEYVDDVRSWQSSEPALDMTGSMVLAASLQEALLGGTSSSGNDFSLSLSPSSDSVTAGGSATATVDTAVDGGAAESVALTASGAPSGVTVSFSPSSVTSGGSSTLTASTSSSAAAGNYAITVTGTASSGSHATTYTLTVGSGGGAGTIVGTASGLCLGVTGESTTLKSTGDIDTCDGDAAERWTVGSDGTIENADGLCLSVTGSSTTAKASTDVYTCNGSAPEAWTVNSDGTVTNDNSGLCLSVTGGSTTAGAVVDIYTCNQSASEYWKVS